MDDFGRTLDFGNDLGDTYENFLDSTKMILVGVSEIPKTKCPKKSFTQNNKKKGDLNENREKYINSIFIKYKFFNN